MNYDLIRNYYIKQLLILWQLSNQWFESGQEMAKSGDQVLDAITAAGMDDHARYVQNLA